MFKPRAIVVNSREIPRTVRRSIGDTSTFENRKQRDRNGRDVSMSAHLSGKAASRFERTASPGNDSVGIALHPMQCSVGKYRVKFAGEGETETVHDLGID